MENNSLLKHSELSYQVHGIYSTERIQDDVTEYKISPSFTQQTALSLKY